MKTERNVRAPAASSERERVCKKQKSKRTSGEEHRFDAAQRESRQPPRDARCDPRKRRSSERSVPRTARHNAWRTRSRQKRRATWAPPRCRMQRASSSTEHARSIDATPFTPSQRVVLWEGAVEDVYENDPPQLLYWCPFPLAARFDCETHTGDSFTFSGFFFRFRRHSEKRKPPLDGICLILPIRYQRLAMRPKGGCSEWSRRVTSSTFQGSDESGFWWASSIIMIETN